MLAAMMMILLSAMAGQKKPEQIKDDGQSIPCGPAIKLDGQMSPGEWDHALRVSINVAPDWIVGVFLQHDEKNLYVAFTDLKHGGGERYPEVLLDPANRKPLLWKEGQQWWLHASYNLCESNARPNQYAECAPAKAGWDATRFPLKSGVSEMEISLDKAGLSPRKPFGLALDVTDTKGMWSFWPEAAKINIPMSWRTARLE
jgi:hypothetical protein